MSTSLEASTLNIPRTVCVSNSNVNPTDGSLDHSTAIKSGLFVQRKRPVSLGSETDVTFKNIVHEYKQGMTSPIRYYKRSTDCFPSTPNPEVVIPDSEFLVEWYRENHWKVEAHDNARIQLLEVLSKYLPGYGLGDSDSLDAYISVVGHYIDELNTKLNEFDIDIGQISGGEIAGRIESHKTRVFIIISRYKRMLDSANETVYQLRDRINHLDSELTGVLQINSSLRRAMANGDPGAEVTANMQGRAAAALALSSNLKQELHRSRRESQQLCQSVNQLTNQNLSTHEECMQVLANLTQKVEINTMLEEAIRNHINQLGASMDKADRIVEDWYNSITRSLSERDLEIAELQQRVQYKNNEIARLSAQHENLLRQSGELKDRVRRAKEAIMMQEAEVANMEELGVNRTFTRPMNFTHSSAIEDSIPCGFGPTESTGDYSEYLSPVRAGTFTIPVVNRTVTIPASNRTVTIPASNRTVTIPVNTTVTVPTVNRTFSPQLANLTGSPKQTVTTVPSPVYVVQTPSPLLNTTGRVSPVINDTSPSAVISAGFTDDSFDESFEVGASVGKVRNTIDIGQGLNMTTSVSGSPRALRQWTTVDHLVPGSESDSLQALNSTTSPRALSQWATVDNLALGSYSDSPQALNTTTGYSPRSRDPSASSAGSPGGAVITPWFIDNSDDSFNSSGSCDGRYVDLSKVIIPDETVNDVFYLPGEPLEYPALLKNYRSANVQSYPRRRIYRKPSPGKSIRNLSERQCLTDWYAPTIDDMTQYSTMDDLSSNSPRGTYIRSPKGSYVVAPKGSYVVAPKGTYTEAPRGTYVGKPKGTYTEASSVTSAYSPTYTYPSYTASPPGVYTFSPTHPYSISGRAATTSPIQDSGADRLVDSPMAVNTTVCISPRNQESSASSASSPSAVIRPWFIDYSDDSFNSSGSCDGRYVDLSKVIIPDETVDDVFYLPGEPLEYPALLKNYRSANVQSYPRRRIYRKPSPGKSIRNLSERQCLTDWYAPTIDDMTQYSTMDDLSSNSPRGTYTRSPKGSYVVAPKGSYVVAPKGTYTEAPRGTYTHSPTTNFSYPSYTASPPGAYTFSPTHPYTPTQDSPLKKSVLLKTPNKKAPFVLDIDVHPQPIVQTESGEHIVCDVSLDVQETNPVIQSDFPRQRVFSYSTPPTTYSPRSPTLLGTPKSIFEKDYYAIRNLARKFDEEDYELSPVINLMSPNRTLTPSPKTDLDRTY